MPGRPRFVGRNCELAAAGDGRGPPPSAACSRAHDCRPGTLFLNVQFRALHRRRAGVRRGDGDGRGDALDDLRRAAAGRPTSGGVEVNFATYPAGKHANVVVRLEGASGPLATRTVGVDLTGELRRRRCELRGDGRRRRWDGRRGGRPRRHDRRGRHGGASGGGGAAGTGTAASRARAPRGGGRRAWRRAARRKRRNAAPERAASRVRARGAGGRGGAGGSTGVAGGDRGGAGGAGRPRRHGRRLHADRSREPASTTSTTTATARSTARTATATPSPCAWRWIRRWGSSAW